MDESYNVTEAMMTALNECNSKEELLHFASDWLSLPFCDTAVKAAWPVFLEKLNSPKAHDICCIDYMALFHRVFARGKNINDVIHDEIKDMSSGYDKVFICVDSETSWRKDKYAGYKGKRRDKPDGFDEMSRACADLNDCSGMILKFDGHEADDIMASVAFLCKVRKDRCVLMTDDRDLWQALGPGVTMFSARANKFTTADSLLQDEGITPKQAVDYLALTGKNDCPKPAGIGPVKAKEILARAYALTAVNDSMLFEFGKCATALDTFLKTDYELTRELLTLNKTLKVIW